MNPSLNLLQKIKSSYMKCSFTYLNGLHLKDYAERMRLSNLKIN